SQLLPILLAVRTLGYTSPAFLADSSALGDGCSAGSVPEVFSLEMRLYGAKAYQGTNWSRLFLRSHTVQPGARDTFQVYDSEAWTYWVVPVNAAGEGCAAGVTVGVPNVGVPLWEPAIGDIPEYLDIQSRRLEKPPLEGVY